MRVTATAIYFHGSIFSQWAQTPLEGRTAFPHLRRLLDAAGVTTPPDGIEITNRLRGKRYPNAEAWMMACKAWLMGDLETLKNIHQLTDPSDIKKLGRKVRPFDAKLWDRACQAVVTAGSIAKFTYSDRMRGELLDTGDRLLVEGSPVDRIWGVGISWRDDAILDHSRWRGRNLLGECLMEARRTIGAGEA